MINFGVLFQKVFAIITCYISFEMLDDSYDLSSTFRTTISTTICTAPMFLAEAVWLHGKRPNNLGGKGPQELHLALCISVPEAVTECVLARTGALGFQPRRNIAGYVRQGDNWAWQEVSILEHR